MESAHVRAQPWNQVSSLPKEAHSVGFILVKLAHLGSGPQLSRNRICSGYTKLHPSDEGLIPTSLRRKILHRIITINLFIPIHLFPMKNMTVIQNIVKLVASTCQAYRSNC